MDFDAFVRFLRSHGHNFTLLWYSELPKIHDLPTTVKPAPEFTVAPHPWPRTGPGTATDGGLKFDLTQLDPAYFDRLRSRVQALGRAGIYAGVYLFSGEFLLRFRSATDGYPLSGPNNVNGVDDGYRGGGGTSATTAVTLEAPGAVTEVQDAYVQKLVDLLNDLPNVLWIVSQEAPPRSVGWNRRLIARVRSYEKTKPWQHPIGYGALDSSPDSILYDSDADWVAPTARISPASSSGAGQPPRKVNVNDSDHSYWEMWKESAQKNRNYAWKNFTMGNQVLFMDPYVVYYPRESRNLCPAPVRGISLEPDPRWDNFRDTLGYILGYSRRLDLAEMVPSPGISSTRFGLARSGPGPTQILVYAPEGGPFTVDLSGVPASRTLAVEWFDPASGKAILQDPVRGGPSQAAFTPPFAGDAVLFLADSGTAR